MSSSSTCDRGNPLARHIRQLAGRRRLLSAARIAAFDQRSQKAYDTWRRVLLTPLAALLLMLLLSPRFLLAQEEPLVADPARDLFDLATLYYNEGPQSRANYRLAARKFSAFLADHPNHPRRVEAHYFLALSHQKLNENQDARRHFIAVTKRAASGKFLTGAALQLAAASYEAKQWKDAASWFKILVRSADDKKVRHEALYRHFLCFRELQDETGMTQTLRAILREPEIPYAETARRSLAALYQKQNKHRAAFSLYAKLAASSDPKTSADATLQAALIAQKVGDPKQAPQWFEAAFKHPGLKEWRGQTQLTLMDFAYRANNWREVVTLYEKGQFPLKEQAALQRHILAAKSYEALKESQKAVRIYEKIDRLAPKSDTGFEAAYHVLIKAYEAKRGHFIRKARDFLDDYSRTHGSDPKIHTVRLLLADAYFTKKDYQRAIARYRGLHFALVRPANRLGVRYRMARCLLALKKNEEALRVIATILEKHPKSPQAAKLRLQRAELLTDMGRGREALTDYQTLLSTSDPKVKSLVLQRLAVLYRESQQYDRFAQTQRDLLALPDLSKSMRASATFWLGWDAYRRKEHRAAVTLLRKARALSPSYTKQAAPLLIRCAYHLEDLESLEDEITRLRRLDKRAEIPGDIQLWLGATLARKAEYRRAWPLLRDGIQPDSKPVMWRLYTATATALEHHREALKGSKLLLRLETHPYRRAEAFYQQSLALTGLKKFPSARETLSEAMDLRPTGELDLKLRFQAGDLEMAAARPQDALRHYLIVESLYTKEPADKRTALKKLIACLSAIGTPDALKKRAEFEKKLIRQE